MKLRLRARPGFSLSELLIALLLTAIVGAAVTGVFVSQNRFFEIQEKEGLARGVSRSAMNIIMSEMRMIDHDSGLVAASSNSVQLRVPYAMGVACLKDSGNGQTIAWILPYDTSYVFGTKTYGGYAYRQTNGVYTYVPTTGNAPTATGSTTTCNNNRIEVGLTAGTSYNLKPHPTTNPTDIYAGAPIFLYQDVTYTFSASAMVPGRLGLWRQVGANTPEEILAPFAGTSRFRFFHGTERGAAQDAAPANLSLVHGIELVLDGISERPDQDGTYRTVPLTTAVYFKNRRS